jgi:cell fate regulator YaaT (PSP1 superfamily)
VAHLIEVAFRGNRKEFFAWDGETPPPLRAGIIVEADRGEDFGRVHSTGKLAEVRCNGCAHGCGTAPPARRALRLATKEDEQLDRALTDENESVRRRAMERVKHHHLVMKMTDAEWQWDRRKLTLYFTAEKRVDFRDLVRDLAALFKTRIELKQIGVRDEAKRLNGVGRCGREYCSSSWLPDLRPVNLGVAKDQKLSLNPQQISGACGRLMCCLRYEHEFYVLSRRRFPKEGKIVTTSRGEEKVMACDIFGDKVTLRTAEGDTRVISLAEYQAETGTVSVPAEMEHSPSSTLPDEISLDDTTLRMLDTAEFRVVSAAMFTTPEALGASSTAATAAAADTDLAPLEAPAFDGVDEEEDGDEGSDEGSDEASQAAEGTDPAPPRRKRRRGRRGGRRLRAAEQKRRDGESEVGPESGSETHPD